MARYPSTIKCNNCRGEISELQLRIDGNYIGYKERINNHLYDVFQIRCPHCKHPVIFRVQE